MDEVEIVRGGSSVPVQVRKKRRQIFTSACRAKFLQALAATCNVGFAAQAAGMAKKNFYKRRRRDPQFEAEWRAAIMAGYERLETALLARAMGTDAIDLSACEFGDPEEIVPAAKIDTELALKLLSRHRASVEGRARGRRLPRIATEEETNAALLKQLAVLRRRVERSGGAILLEHKE